MALLKAPQMGWMVWKLRRLRANLSVGSRHEARQGHHHCFASLTVKAASDAIARWSQAIATRLDGYQDGASDARISLVATRLPLPLSNSR